MFSWFSCWNPQGRNVLVGFLLGFHEKHFHSSSPVPLNFQGHGVLRDSQVCPFPGSTCRLWVSNECGDLLEWGHFSHQRCFCSSSELSSSDFCSVAIMGSPRKWPDCLGYGLGWSGTEMERCCLSLDLSYLLVVTIDTPKILSLSFLIWMVIESMTELLGVMINEMTLSISFHTSHNLGKVQSL